MKLKSVIEAALFAIILGLSSTASATEQPYPEGCYSWDTGNLSIVINIPRLVRVNVGLPGVGLMGMEHSFTWGGDYFMPLPFLDLLQNYSGDDLEVPAGLNGTWEMGRGRSFSVDVQDIDELAEMLDDLGMTYNLTKRFNGTVSNDGNVIKGNFLLGLVVPMQDLGLPGRAQVRIAGRFAGERQSPIPCPIPVSASAAIQEEDRVDAKNTKTTTFGQIFINMLRQAQAQPK
ncbi:hypothetical protein [Methylotuvimicrobium buryatense]|uniref:Uncharacterized protein n=1 Tax=Methylotuvimicrobium buryatense TaxID=95641 RepID=A0A4P9UUX9_METBY|nr:hypothetical protein [Methylotuvimicrobium buryatense]QCW83496.1 hypothetical protein EQU24_15515 [Methylotuvimicrobium buryatense]